MQCDLTKNPRNSEVWNLKCCGKLIEGDVRGVRMWRGVALNLRDGPWGRPWPTSLHVEEKAEVVFYPHVQKDSLVSSLLDPPWKRRLEKHHEQFVCSAFFPQKIIPVFPWTIYCHYSLFVYSIFRCSILKRCMLSLFQLSTILFRVFFTSLPFAFFMQYCRCHCTALRPFFPFMNIRCIAIANKCNMNLMTSNEQLFCHYGEGLPRC